MNNVEKLRDVHKVKQIIDQRLKIDEFPHRSLKHSAGTRCLKVCLGVESDRHHPRSEGQVKHSTHTTQIKPGPWAAESTERPVTHGDRVALLFLSDPYSLGTARLTGLHMDTINTQHVGCFRPRHTAHTEASLKSVCARMWRKFTSAVCSEQKQVSQWQTVTNLEAFIPSLNPVPRRSD